MDIRQPQVLGYVTRFPLLSVRVVGAGQDWVWYGSASGVFNGVMGLPVLGMGGWMVVQALGLGQTDGETRKRVG